MGAFWELLAFIFRALQTHHQDSEIYGTFHVAFFLLAPICKRNALHLSPKMSPLIWYNLLTGINAFIYMTLGRMIHFFLPERRLVGLSARHYGIVFVTLDIIAFLVQLGGASLMSNTDPDTNTVLLGLHLYMGGIGMQEFFILCFLGLAIQMHRVMLRMEEQGQLSAEKLRRRRFSWRWLFYSMYFALSMITVRIT